MMIKSTDRKRLRLSWVSSSVDNLFFSSRDYDEFGLNLGKSLNDGDTNH